MAKLRKFLDPNGDEGYNFFCKGCDEYHTYYTKTGNPKTEWQFNGNVDRPTFQPSLLMKGHRWPTEEEYQRIIKGEKITLPERICHLYVTDGMIQFLTDCTHELAGKTVPMKEES